MKRIEIYNPNYSIWKNRPLYVPSNGGTTYSYDSLFFADDKIFNADTLVEFTYSYNIGTGYGLTKIINENGNELLPPANSYSRFILDQKIGQLDKLFLFDYIGISAKYFVYSLPGAAKEKEYFFPIERVILKNFGSKYLNIGYGTSSLYHDNHSFWKTIDYTQTPNYKLTLESSPIIVIH